MESPLSIPCVPPYVILDIRHLDTIIVYNSVSNCLKSKNFPLESTTYSQNENFWTCPLLSKIGITTLEGVKLRFCTPREGGPSALPNSNVGTCIEVYLCCTFA